MPVLEILFEGAARPPAGAPIIVRLRESSLQDAAATVLAEKSATVSPGSGPLLASIDLDTSHLEGSGHTIWALVDVNRDGRVSKGDYVTTESYPVPRQDNAEIHLKVKQV